MKKVSRDEWILRICGTICFAGAILLQVIAKEKYFFLAIIVVTVTGVAAVFIMLSTVKIAVAKERERIRQILQEEEEKIVQDIRALIEEEDYTAAETLKEEHKRIRALMKKI